MANKLGDAPPAFKPIQHYLKTASEQDSRDPVIAYYCRLYAMQKGMEIDKKSPECREFLRSLMTYLEKMKTDLKDHESIKTELVGQAHVEDFAFKLFFYADTEDRNGNAEKNVVKAFYTSSMLFDVLTTFGELSEDVDKCRRYAKYKAAYIHNCLKMGMTPHPGPVPEAAEELGISTEYQFNQPKRSNSPTDQPTSSQPPAQPYNHPPTQPSYTPPTQPSYPPSQPTHPSFTQEHLSNESHSGSKGQQQQQRPEISGTAANNISAEAFAQAMKFCKYANSAMQYEDAQTAVDNLTKALNLLTRP